jgi:hypothetical protein
MSNTVVIRPLGKTYALSVTASATTSLQIANPSNDQINYASFLNTGDATVAIEISSLGTAPAATLPVSGTPGSFVLAPKMTLPVVLATPNTPFTLTAIGSAAGPSLVYVTVVGTQN